MNESKAGSYIKREDGTLELVHRTGAEGAKPKRENGDKSAKRKTRTKRNDKKEG